MTRRPTTALLVATALASSLVLSGCAREISANTHDGPAVGEVLRTYQGTVESMRVVTVEEGELLEQNKTGQLVGGLAGGFAGSAIGSGLGQAAAIAAGAIAGAVIGSLIEEEAKTQTAMEYVVRDDLGNLVTIVQGLEPEMALGQRVFVQEGRRGRSRIIPAL